MLIAKNDARHLILRERPPWLVLAALAALALVTIMDIVDGAPLAAALAFPAALYAVLMGAVSVSFDKAHKRCSIRSFDLRGFKRRDFGFDEIVDIRIEPRPGSPRGVETCRLSLITAEVLVPLSLRYEPGPQRYRRMRQEIVEVVFPGRAQPHQQNKDAS